MINIYSDKFKNSDEGLEFYKDNPDIGKLKIEAFYGYSSIPGSNIKIYIYKDIEDYRVIFYEGITNSNGMITGIELPAPIKNLGLDTNDRPKYTLYNLVAVDPRNNSSKTYEIGMFGGVSIIQYIKLGDMS